MHAQQFLDEYLTPEANTLGVYTFRMLSTKDALHFGVDGEFAEHKLFERSRGAAFHGVLVFTTPRMPSSAGQMAFFSESGLMRRAWHAAIYWRGTHKMDPLSDKLRWQEALHLLVKEMRAKHAAVSLGALP